MTHGRPMSRRGRGAPTSPDARYLAVTREPFDDGWADDDAPAPELHTTVTAEQARSIISYNTSPDIPFDRSINAYRGCEHGCVYCYARPTHAYLDLSPGLDFESRLYAKPNAAELLKQELSKPGYRCRFIALGTNTDPYQPIERDWRITRQVLEVLAACHHPVSIVTKSSLVERDIDLLTAMAGEGLVEVYLSVTTLDRDLARRMEPRAATPQRRLDTLARLAEAGVPTGVLFAPVIPFLNDAEMEAVLEEAAARGVRYAGYVMLRLPHEVRPLFEQWLAEHEPGKAERVLNRIRDLRGGRENDPHFGRRMRGTGVYADLMRSRYTLACKRLGLNRSAHALDTSRFSPPITRPQQLTLW
ncbi:MAG: PA0069 family radical SAM protein [Gammaproteobacteria bacterium]